MPRLDEEEQEHQRYFQKLEHDLRYFKLILERASRMERLAILIQLHIIESEFICKCSIFFQLFENKSVKYNIHKDVILEVMRRQTNNNIVSVFT